MSFTLVRIKIFFRDFALSGKVVSKVIAIFFRQALRPTAELDVVDGGEAFLLLTIR